MKEERGSDVVFALTRSQVSILRDIAAGRAPEADKRTHLSLIRRAAVAGWYASATLTPIGRACVRLLDLVDAAARLEPGAAAPRAPAPAVALAGVDLGRKVRTAIAREAGWERATYGAAKKKKKKKRTLKN